MASLTALLTQQLSNAFEACGLAREFGRVVLSQRPDLGQFQCSGALAAANRQQTKPRQVAEAVVRQLEDQAGLRLSIAGPGFINITLSDELLAAHTQRMAQDERLGCDLTLSPETVLIDFGGPNIAKPMHVGHLRSSIIGDSLQRLFRFRGDKVLSDIHLGDWGTPVGMLIEELKRHRPDLPYFDPAYTGPYPAKAPVTITDLQELYPQAAARCQAAARAMQAAQQATLELQQGRPGYRALWRHFSMVSMAALKADFDRLGVKFDLWLGESDVHELIPPMLQKLEAADQAQFSDGALVVAFSQRAEEPDLPPLILVKAGGGYLYSTTDLATIVQRVNEFQADRLLYVVDARQGFHFRQLFQAARQTGLAGAAQFEHIAFGTVNGPDGKPFKTRAGGVMPLKELVTMVTAEALKRMQESNLAAACDEAERLRIARQVGLAALKFADLANHRTSDYVFELEKFTRFEGRTGPYLLYTAVRIKSILRNAAQAGLAAGPITVTHPLDRELMLVLNQLPDAVESAYEERLPSHLCEFAYELAQTFNRFYNRCHILTEPNPAVQASWLALSRLTLAELELLLSLLGIEIPERM